MVSVTNNPTRSATRSVNFGSDAGLNRDMGNGGHIAGRGRDPLKRLQNGINKVMKREEEYGKIVKAIGIPEEKFMHIDSLHTISPATLKRYYNANVGLLRCDPSERASGRGSITANPALLSISPGKLLWNLQYMEHLGINLQEDTSPKSYLLKGHFLMTTPMTKRKKIAFMLREMTDYSKSDRDGKRLIIESLYQVVRENTSYLGLSEKRMMELKEKIKSKFEAAYRGMHG